MKNEKALIPVERIEGTIIVLGGHGEEVHFLRSQFVTLTLIVRELRNLIFHFGTSSWGGIRKPPRAFTEQGVVMLSSVLRGKRAVRVNIEIMRAFVRLRRMLQANTVLARQLRDLEKKYDSQFKVVFEAIRQLMTPAAKKRHRIGFKAAEGEK